MKRTAKKTKKIAITTTSVRVLDMKDLAGVDGGYLPRAEASAGTGVTC